MVLLREEQLRELEKRLNDVISQTLGGPAGDPADCNLLAAAHAYKLLKMLDLPVKNEADNVATLQGNNVYDQNFL